MGYTDYETSYEIQSKWNMDNEILKLIKTIKMSFLTNLKSWDLDQAYFDLVLYYSEIKAKFKPKEKEELDDDFKKLEKNRTKYINLNNHDKKEKSGMLYSEILNLYSKMNTFCKVHGLWFRESGDDNRGL